MESKYLSFNKRERKEGAKTDTWFIFSKTDQATWLGQIKWFTAWRKYCFFPNSETVWDPNCLESIIEFLKEIQANRNEGKQNPIEMYTDGEMWKLVEEANWTLDHDYQRIRKLFHSLPTDKFQQLEQFVNKKVSDLANKFKNDWLGNPGISVSDDGWMDLTSEVVGRGKDFYDNITVEKLRKMADENDYHENFTYSF